jgi:hypothetical protein
MAIYSTPLADIAKRVAAKKNTPKKNPANGFVGKVDPVIAKLSKEEQREHKNRLARERRARAKQALADVKAGVTLATGHTVPPTVDPTDPVHVPPRQKETVPARKRKSPPAAVQQQVKHLTPPPSVSSSCEDSEEDDDGGDHGDDAAADDEQVEPEEEPEPPKKKVRVVREPAPVPVPVAPGSDEPPRWYTNLLTEIVRMKTEEAGEKASKKIIKETGDEIAKEKWADPLEREKTRANQDKLYNQMFGRWQ